MNNSNLFMAMALSAAILIGFHFFYEKPRQEAYAASLAAQQAAAARNPALVRRLTPNSPLYERSGNGPALALPRRQ